MKRFLSRLEPLALAKRIALLVAMAGALAGAAAHAKPVQVPGFSFVRSVGDIDEYRLDSNGLQVLLKQDHSAPVVTFNVTYRVGSRNEVTGTTGATHMLEHLMFKGTEKYSKAKGNDAFTYLERVGGRYNATTYTDRTNYYATLGVDALENYIAIEADRMRNLRLRDEDRKSEMVVVRNEFERGKNNPSQVMTEEMRAAAYQALPYHHPTIGWRSDIENVPIERLQQFYDTFYWPNNATAVAVGDIQPAAVLGLIRKYYGGYSKSPHPIPQIYTEEPEQTGPRRVTVKKPGELGSLAIAHKTPGGTHPDQAAIAVLDYILSDGKESRLYRALVDRGIALDIGAYSRTFRDMNLHYVLVDLAPGATNDQGEKAAIEVLERLKAEGVTDAEVNRAKQKYKAAAAYRLDGTSGVVSDLNEWIATGDWTLFSSFPEAVQQVTAADVQRVARQYLVEDQSTTGWFVPIKASK